MKKTIIFTTFLALATVVNAATFYLNHAGYDANGAKSIVIKSNGLTDGASFELVAYSDQGSSTVYTGHLNAGVNPDNWIQGDSLFYVADFSSWTTPGTYFIRFDEETTLGTMTAISNFFEIDENLMADSTFLKVLNYFYNDRATNYAKTAYIYGGDYQSVDVHGGWYDASGDASKYLSHLSYANYLNPQQIPLTVWALAFTAEKNPKYLESIGKQESTKAEAVYGADFLVRMLSDEGFFYMTVFDNWGGGSFYLCEFTGSDGIKSSNYQTAYRQGGGMAIAALARASALGIDGEFTSANYLEAAKKGFEHLESKQVLGGSCEYCNDKKENIIDDYTALLAALELYNATKISSYMDVARKRAEHLAGRLSDEGYFWSDEEKTRPFWHASDAGLPLVALVRYLELEKDASKASAIKTAAKRHLEWMLKITADDGKNPFGYARQAYKTEFTANSKTEAHIKEGYFIPHDNESGYWWQGEDARIASLAAASVYASRILKYSDSTSAYKYAANQLDWVLGKNPYNMSFMKGVGKNNPANYNGTRLSLTLTGGIANGITGYNTDGSGIAWNDSRIYVNSWDSWRWVEQWIPHTTWFLMALSTRYDEVKTQAAPEPSSSSSSQGGDEPSSSSSSDEPSSSSSGGDAIVVAGAIPQLHISTANRTLIIDGDVSLQGRTFHIVNMMGQVVHNGTLTAGSNSVQLSNLSGVMFVQIPGFASQKILVK